MQKGDRVRYRASLCGEPYGNPTLGLDPFRVGTFCALVPKRGPGYCVVKWDDDERAHIVSVDVIAVAGSRYDTDPFAADADRRIAWYAQTTPAERGFGTVECPACVPPLKPLARVTGERRGPKRHVQVARVYLVDGDRRVLCEPCALRARRLLCQSVTAPKDHPFAGPELDASVLAERAKIAAGQSKRFVTTEETAERCERCSQLKVELREAHRQGRNLPSHLTQKRDE